MNKLKMFLFKKSKTYRRTCWQEIFKKEMQEVEREHQYAIVRVRVLMILSRLRNGIDI